MNRYKLYGVRHDCSHPKLYGKTQVRKGNQNYSKISENILSADFGKNCFIYLKELVPVEISI